LRRERTALYSFAMRDELRAQVGRRYSGAAHLAFTLVVSLGVTVLLYAQVRAPGPLVLLTVPLFFVFCCLLEYLEHRYLLHRRTRLAAMAFRIHTLEHHRFFTDAAFEPESLRDYAFILFPPPLVLGYMLVIVPAFGGLFYLAVSPNVGWLVGGTAALFFFLYEVIHFASHLGDRFPIRLAPLRRLAEHHRLHHRAALMTSCNFNVVCPIFDWAFGTLRRER
jgi:sterol desaturase/sphingolipid hydroxylase (fatty acid hydroxylase superfamily)